MWLEVAAGWFVFEMQHVNRQGRQLLGGLMAETCHTTAINNIQIDEPFICMGPQFIPIGLREPLGNFS